MDQIIVGLVTVKIFGVRNKMKSYSRGNFFRLISNGIIFGSIVSLFPFKKIFAKRNNQQKIVINPHPSAVKRIKKV